MARNKYPEETVLKIIEVGTKLFMTKGYDKTSMQDIADELKMTKGAIYHHFNSKEELFEKVSESYFSNLDWFDEIRNNNSLSGLEKIKALFLHELGNEQKKKIDSMSKNVYSDSKILVENIKNSIIEVEPAISQILKEGIKDGSMTVKYPKQLSEVMLLVINFWMNPIIFMTTKEEFMQKTEFLGEMLSYMGLPLFDEEMKKIVSCYYDEIVK